MEGTCACGHEYDEHEGRGEECQAVFRFPLRAGGGEQKCSCVYFEARDPDEGDESKAD